MRKVSDAGSAADSVVEPADRIGFRLLEQRDGEIVFRWISDPALRRLTGTRGEVTQEGHQRWLSAKLKDHENRTFVIELDGCPAGLIGINGYSSENRNAEMYLYIGDESDRAKGIGTAAIRRFVRKMFEEAGLHKLTARVFSFNPASMRAFERAGFLLEGIQKEQIARDGVYFDLYLYGLIDHKDLSPEVTP